MENPSFFIEYVFQNHLTLAEVKPCCNTDEVWYYDILIKNHYQFTVTPVFDDKSGMHWKVSLKNADKDVDSKLIDIIGQEIEKHLFMTH